MMNNFAGRLVACVILSFILQTVFAEMNRQPFAPCPASPNCVSSLTPESDAGHHIAPLRFDGPPAQAWRRLKEVLRREKRLTIVTEQDEYLHAEARSLVFRFVDDIEFSLHAEAGLIHIRSAARSGYSDFGVNRRRIEHLREAFNSRPAG